ncbi:MAG: SagB/ThcOx family dehydrogenase [Synechococcales cyanobacterium RM1_1_8]|nr:SagB/ThcOx family dehydrogenase [Synechococcales cyanobacterium RM1_1_8]
MDACFSLAQHYHERTKYHPETLAQQGRALDWSQQPEGFKIYQIGAVVDLKPYVEGSLVEVEAATLANPLLARLSQFFLCSYGLTREIATPNGPLYLRAAPSAGGLYPAEIYLVSSGLGVDAQGRSLAAGVYSYQPHNHSLVRFWDEDRWPQLREACLWHPNLENTHLALVITAMFERSAWRYQARAYRRICLDTGHLLGNLELAAALVDFCPHLIGGFVDGAVNELLYLDGDLEGAIAVAALADRLDIDQNLPHLTTALASPATAEFGSLEEDELLLALHQASQISAEFGATLNWRKLPKSTGFSCEPFIAGAAPKPPEPVADVVEDKYNFPFCDRLPLQSEPIDWGRDLKGLRETMFQRRSTRAYSGADLSLGDLQALLHFTYQPEAYLLQGLDEAPDYFDLGLVETFVAVSGVTGLDAGCYYYAPKAQELRQIRFKNFRRELHYLCLGQDLGRDAAAVLFHTADLKAAVEKYGDRAYRYLHLDAGHLGQRLNLAAIRLGLGVSGIAGFFDDQVNELLGIPEDEAVLYITTLGRGRSR